MYAVASIQRLPAVSVMTDINFPMKGRKGMVDWARNSEDKVVIPKGLFVSPTAGNVSRYCSPTDNSQGVLQHVPPSEASQRCRNLSLLTNWMGYRAHIGLLVYLGREVEEGLFIL